MILILFLFFVGSRCGQKPAEVSFDEKVVAGSPEHFMEVRHVILKGSNFAIGKKMAEIARHDNIQINPSGEKLTDRVRREYLAGNYPVFYERMKGVSEASGMNIEDDVYDFYNISQYNLIPPVSCSVVFYPGEFTENGHGTLSRNFDFTTGTIEFKHPKEGEMRAVSRPYIFEMYPDRGYDSLAICAFNRPRKFAQAYAKPVERSGA